MKQMVLRNEHLKTGRARINPTVSEMKKYDAHCDRVMYFCQVVDTFICDAFISPLKYPSDFFGQLASTATSEDSVEFRKRVQALGAPTGVTVEILLEWEQFFDDEYAGTSLPPITKAEFIAVGKAMIAFNQLTESSVSVLEKVFDVVYPNQM